MNGASSVPSEPRDPGPTPEAAAAGTADPAAVEAAGDPSGGAPEVSAPSPAAAEGGDAAADRDGGEEQRRIRELEGQLEALRRQHEALNGQYMRIAADFDNFRKRQERDQDDQRLQLTCATLGEILPVVDNFERARQQLDPQHDEAKGLHRSYQGLYKQLVDVLRKFGVSPMRVEGEAFDPTLHEAVMREESDQHPEDVVIAEMQRGYHIDGRVLRHALVKVSMGPGPAGGGAEAAPASEAGPPPEA
jgi:molecular chaperone GrpE